MESDTMTKSCSNKSGKFAVGSIVRAKRGSKRCRGMVATVGVSGDDKDQTLCLLWEPYYPRKIGDKKFWILLRHIRTETVGEEATVAVDEVEALLPFEECSDTDNVSIEDWKERGDRLLRMGDASAAASFYEKALGDSSSISIGGIVMVSIDGFPRMAEVDCTDDDDNTIDVTLVHNEEERTIPQSQVLLGLLEADPTNLQERILLNLARCTLQLANLDAANRPRYLKSTVLATTLAFSLAEFWQRWRQENQQQQQQEVEAEKALPKNAQTALVLRCKAYTCQSKWPRASADARKLIKHGNKEGPKLLAAMERKKKLQFSKDKKLAKDICRLVESAAALNEKALVSPETNAERDGKDERSSLPDAREKQHSETWTQFHFGFFRSVSFAVAIVTALISILLSQANRDT